MDDTLAADGAPRYLSLPPPTLPAPTEMGPPPPVTPPHEAPTMAANGVRRTVRVPSFSGPLALELVNLHKSFGTKHAVDDLTLSGISPYGKLV